MIRLSDLTRLYDINEVIYFENKLYERLSDTRYRYRVIITDDDYDYVTDRNLKRRLDRAFAKK
jgi:hypothetical protein